MKERFIGVGLGVSAALALGVVWTDSAQAFSLGNTVTVTNLLDKGDLGTDIFQGPTDVVVVEPSLELNQFGGIWDIDLDNNSISFTLNSRFGNVTSGNDIYRFIAPSFGQPGQNIVTGFTFTPLQGSLAFRENPVISLLAGNQIDVVFPKGFAPGDEPDLTDIPGQLGFTVNLDVASTPTPIPTPALLPGLFGIGLAVWRRRTSDRAD